VKGDENLGDGRAAQRRAVLPPFTDSADERVARERRAGRREEVGGNRLKLTACPLGASAQVRGGARDRLGWFEGISACGKRRVGVMRFRANGTGDRCPGDNLLPPASDDTQDTMTRFLDAPDELRHVQGGIEGDGVRPKGSPSASDRWG
jgi:hypothetical protein